MEPDEQEKDQIATPGADVEGYVFEQIEGNRFACWNKKENKPVDGFPSELSDYVPLRADELPWKLADNPEDYGDHGTLWKEIRTFIQDHVFLADERLYDVCAAWVLSTWVPETWDVVPYLLVKGPMSSGKTRLLETLEAITYRGIFSANMSCSALFRISELFRPTFFLDETEILNKDEYAEVKHLLNAGYRRGQKAWRVDHLKNGMLTVRGYDVFGFKALAGTQALAKTLQSRSIIVDMVKTPKRINFTVNEKRAKAIRNRLLMWRFHTLTTHSKNGSSDDFDENDDFQRGVYPLLEKLRDGRLMELFYCLLKVSNSGREAIINYATEMLAIREEEEQTGLEYQVLEGILAAKDETENGKLLVKTIRAKVNAELEDKEKLTTNFISTIINGLGFHKTHTNKGVAFVINTRMLDHRVRQFKVGETLVSSEGDTTPLKTSKSSKSSLSHQPDGPEAPEKSSLSSLENSKLSLEPDQHPRFEHCFFCSEPIVTDDWRADDFTNNKPVHKECYVRQWEMQRKGEV